MLTSSNWLNDPRVVKLAISFPTAPRSQAEQRQILGQLEAGGVMSRIAKLPPSWHSVDIVRGNSLLRPLEPIVLAVLTLPMEVMTVVVPGSPGSLMRAVEIHQVRDMDDVLLHDLLEDGILSQENHADLIELRKDPWANVAGLEFVRRPTTA